MKSVKEIPFEYFKDVYKREKNFTSQCPEHKDVYVSYCKDTKEPLCVKCLLIYSKKNKNHEIVSLSELKKSLTKEMDGMIDVLKKNQDKLENYELKNFDEEELLKLKQKGVRKLLETKERVIEQINTSFEQMKTQWFLLFDEHFNLTNKKEKVTHELNLMSKIYLKAQNDNKNMGDLNFKDFKNLIETISMIRNDEYINKKVEHFIKKLDKLSKIQKYPDLTINNIVINKLFEEMKYLFDYNFDYTLERLDTSKIFKFKIPDFFKKNEKQKYDSPKLIPIIAKSRRLMVYDVNMSSFQELLMSEIHSIPQGNQIVVSPVQQNRFFIIGGHIFKNASSKVFEMDTLNSQFKIHPELAVARWLHRATAFKEFIYVTGGTNNEKEIPNNSIERFNTQNSIWDTLPNFKYARHSHCAVLYESHDKTKLDRRPSCLYLFGGIGVDKRYVTQIEKFDIERNSWSEIDFQNSFNFTVIGPFGHQINDNEILLFGGFKYLESKEGPKELNKDYNFILYPFNNPNVFTFNVAESLVTCNNYYHLPYGVQNVGSQLIYYQNKIFFSGNLNTNSFYTNIGNPEYTEENNTQKIVGVVCKDKIKVLDYVLFQ
jgi:hypothetical protein